MSENSSGTIVIGLGNLDRGDDAAGRLVARRLRSLVPGDALVIELDGETTGLLDAWDGFKTVVLIDAVRSGAATGSVIRHEEDGSPLPAPFSHGSTHTMGLREAIELARVLGRLPDQLVVHGIVGERFGLGDERSPAVDAAIADLAPRVAADLQQLRNRGKEQSDGHA